MKTHINLRITFLFFTILLTPFLSTAQWELQNSGTSADLNSVFFINENDGWAVGTEGTILRTTNGGENWDLQTIGTNFSLNSVHFVDPDLGWIAGGQIVDSGIILRTINGGENWDVVYFDEYAHGNDIFFIDSLNGWSVRVGYYSGQIIHSNNGGLTWNYQFASWNIHSIQFIDENNGWVAGGYVNGSTGNPTCIMLNTTDGGNTWTEQINSSPQGILFGVSFVDQHKGWAAGGNPGMHPSAYSTIFHTENGGETWETQNSLSNRVLTDVCFNDSLNGWAVGGFTYQSLIPDSSIILHTNDGGANWEYQNGASSRQLNSVCFPDQYHGWIAGDSGTILHTDNGGLTGIEQYNSANWHTQLQFLSYPNPFSGSVTFEYELNENAIVILEIFNHLGQGVDLLVKEMQSKGTHQVKWNTEGLPAGVYMVRLQAGAESVVRKLIVK
jgi:photosystem II stability/assembly factor-like uncharacterized protein